MTNKTKIKYMVIGGFLATPMFVLLQLAFSVGDFKDGISVIGTGIGLSVGWFYVGKIIGDSLKGVK